MGMGGVDLVISGGTGCREASGESVATGNGISIGKDSPLGRGGENGRMCNVT